MFNPSDTFPYIGLRPFSEEDSLYFKGRDEQILQLTALLEANKFLMVTGASGDGKSSLVYAGLVPNARAGFFNAKYTNWVVADFRPERTPLVNLSKTISRNLRIGNDESVEVELRRGFSSLVELYTNSSLFLDEQTELWTTANADEQDHMQRKAANLLIVADQFEEFFTNPENYYKNSPSPDSQLVINLLLETARISILKNLPIYIVCTMRSDYIGQCAAFRGLPEFIGFSQFFVPRLKRKEMVQVVKEPAELHGDKISNRLIERVVYDLGEGIDQLPVLEHAMNEVWIQAKNGLEELDLIHYAMAGGMSAKELLAEDKSRFEAWYNTLPSKIQNAYHVPGLSRIIDTHANKLYLSASDHYNRNHDKKITSEEAQLIIKVAFVCLTKMDEGRAVRNRMTLQEITNIIANPDLTNEVVGGVLNIFREPGNTFLRPYISEDAGSVQLKPETVLDITHESLIRNWDLLDTWAKEEYDHLTVYEDFKKQMDRWLASNKSKSFLLPIGPLTFFENWHSQLQPNQYWVNRYLDPGLDKATRLAKAKQIVEDTQEFLKRSATKVRITRMVVKYGAARIAAVIGSILILALCAFYYRDAQQKLNDNVVKSILEEGVPYISDPRFHINVRADFLITSEFMKPGSFKRIMDNVRPDQQFDLIIKTYRQFIVYGGNPPLRKYSIYYGDSLVKSVPLAKNDPVFLMERLKALNVLVNTASHYLYFYRDQRVEDVLQNALKMTKEIIPIVFNQEFDPKKLKMTALDDGMENILNHNTINKEETNRLLSLISPFEGEKGKENFHHYFPLEEQILYNGQNQVKHNDGYQQLAYLYGHIGKEEKVEACLDSLLKYHPNYATFQTNFLNITPYLFKNGYHEESDRLLAFCAQKLKVSKKELYELWLNCSGYMDQLMMWKFSNAENHNANLEFLDYRTVNKIFDQYYKVILETYHNQDALNFNIALYCKQRGVILSKIDEDHAEYHRSNLDSIFSKSIEFYKKVSKDYLNQNEEIWYKDPMFGINSKQRKKRSDLFVYPDHLQKILNSRYAPVSFFSSSFIDYLLRKDHFSLLFTEVSNFSSLNEWMLSYNQFNRPNDLGRLNQNYTPLSIPMLRKMDSVFTYNPIAATLNSNLIRLLLIDEYLKKGEIDKVDSVYKKLQINRIQENFRLGVREQLTMAYRVERLTEYLASAGRMNEVFKIIGTFTNRASRIKAYATAPIELLSNEGGKKEDAYAYLDSALTEFDRIQDFFFWAEDPRISMVLSSSLIGGQKMNKLAMQLVSKISIGQQSGATQSLILGTALNGDYYQAYSSIPEIALVDRLSYFNIILTTEGLRKTHDKEWSTYFMAYRQYWIWENITYEAEVL